MTKRLKIFIALAIILVLVLLYVLLSPKLSRNNEPTSVISKEQISQAQETLNILSLLNIINLDVGFFENPSFKSLYSFSVELLPPELGKNNPFAP